MAKRAPGPRLVAAARGPPILSCMDVRDGVDELVGALAARRRLMRMSQEEVAAACGVSQATISRIEDGLTDPSLRVLLDYADYVGLELSWRLGPRP